MRYALFAFPALLVCACSGNGAARDDGPVATRSFAASGFHAVRLAGSDTVNVRRGASFSVTARGPQGVLDRLDIHTEGDALVVGHKREGWHMGWTSGRSAVVTVTLPVLTGAAVAGSGDMTIDHAQGDQVGVSVSGSGGLSIAEVHAEATKVAIAGSGDVSLHGTTGALAVNVAGSGNYHGEGLVAQDARISVAGSGDAAATARRSADISIVGSGDVTVTGTANCHVSKVGSGEAVCHP